MTRSRTLAVALGLATGVLAGCTSTADGPAAAEPPASAAGDADLTPPDPPPPDEPGAAVEEPDTTDEPPPAPSARPYRALPDDVVLDRELVAQAPEQVTSLAVRPGDDRLFAADKRGRIWIVDAGVVLDTALLDLSDDVRSGSQTSEQGMLSIAFHPHDPDRLFVYYVTEGDDDTVLEELRLRPDGNAADTATRRTVLDVPQPFRWHNGGQLVFGPDRMLWLSLGDGGISGDPDLVAQDPTSLLGTVIRIDVDTGEPYAVPDDNPFANGIGGAPEVWAYGLRNPWSLAFDTVEWRMYIADVGQHLYEWVNVVAHDEGGANFGWPIVEGSACFAEHESRCPGEGFVDPVLEYARTGGECAIIGGHVYEGSTVPDLAGHYFYTDFCAGWLRSFRYHDGEVRDERDWTEEFGSFDFPVAVAADPDGELLVSDDLGSIWRIVPG